jgi:putative IMPACT (imprinted ancient) family translation regulator
MGYLVPSAYGEAEFVERHSRFIGRIWPVETEEEAIRHIKETRRRHWDATHNVYAYILKKALCVYSDDGELRVPPASRRLMFCAAPRFIMPAALLPATSVEPCLNGGLVRAYSQAASLALKEAGLSLVSLWERVLIACPYALYERVKKELLAAEAIIDSTDFGPKLLSRLC